MPDKKDDTNPVSLQGPQEYTPKLGMKKINGPKSMFDGRPKAPTQQQFEQSVQATEDRLADYRKRAADLFVQFNRIVNDKTLPENRNIFSVESEREILQNILQLGEEVNADIKEKDGMGSLTIITLLLKTCLSQRDKINQLEYAVLLLQKKTDPTALTALINKEIDKALDKKKDSE